MSHAPPDSAHTPPLAVAPDSLSLKAPMFLPVRPLPMAAFRLSLPALLLSAAVILVNDFRKYRCEKHDAKHEIQRGDKEA